MSGLNVKQVTSIEFSNEAAPGQTKADENIPYYITLVKYDNLPNLLYIEAKSGDNILNVTRSEEDDIVESELAAYKIMFSTPIQDKKTQTIRVIEEYANRKIAFPKKMNINDEPKVIIVDDAYFTSLYFTKKMKSTFEVGESSTVLTATEVDSGEIRGRSVRYGTYKNIEAVSTYPIIIHMNYNDPLPIYTSVTRTATVSHWKRINIDEEYRLSNRISTLDGEFGRIDYNQWKIRYAISEFECYLPKSTEDLYYTDEIGNVTSSRAFRNNKHTKFMLEPRFPLMGGWKTYWKQGYTLPLWDHVTSLKETDMYQFEIDLSHPYDNIVAEDFTFTIVLPEGAVPVNLDLPFEMDSMNKETVYEYLDLKGRTAIVMKKKMILKKYHNLKVSVTYKLSTLDIYFKPALVCFYTFIVVFFLLVSFRLSSSPNSKVKSQ